MNWSLKGTDFWWEGGRGIPSEEDVVSLVGYCKLLAGNPGGGGRQSEQLWVSRHHTTKGVDPLHTHSSQWSVFGGCASLKQAKSYRS